MTAKPPKRPRDFSQAAKFVVDVATGQAEDRPLTPEEQGKDPAAAAMGRKGGAARAAKISAEKRREIASKAALTRWKPK
jgi:hypothetical protein